MAKKHISKKHGVTIVQYNSTKNHGFMIVHAKKHVIYIVHDFFKKHVLPGCMYKKLSFIMVHVQKI